MKIEKSLLLVIALAVLGIYWGCGGRSVEDLITTENQTPSFSVLNAAVFQAKCAICHTPGGSSSSYNMTSYAEIMQMVVAGNADASELYKQVSTGAMPPSGALTTTQISQIKSWIDGGALNN